VQWGLAAAVALVVGLIWLLRRRAKARTGGPTTP